MKNSEQTAFPIPDGQGDCVKYAAGLTKREYFAAMAMHGFCANNHEDMIAMDKAHIAKLSISHADELLKALEK